jgi:hypothetical protein
MGSVTEEYRPFGCARRAKEELSSPSTHKLAFSSGLKVFF